MSGAPLHPLLLCHLCLFAISATAFSARISNLKSEIALGTTQDALWSQKGRPLVPIGTGKGRIRDGKRTGSESNDFITREFTTIYSGGLYAKS
jgi:hypothetical protein